MKIRLPIPKRVFDRILTVYGRWEDWANETAFKIARFDVLRLDLVMAALFVLCVAYYYWTGGWMGALAGGLMFAMLLICTLWIWRK